MRFDVITLMPEMFVALHHGLVGQALHNGRAELHVLNPRQFTRDLHQSVDDRPFGGGDGMILMAEPLAQAVAHVHHSLGARERGPVVALTAQGEPISAGLCKRLSGESQVTLVCGRYGGIDQRFLSTVDLEVSVGDCVVSGGELPAMMLMDSCLRLIPGVLGNQESAEQDSFYSGLLESPQFTRPREWRGQSVPEVLLSGNHKLITEAKRLISILVTKQRRPDLLAHVPEAECAEAERLRSQMTRDELKGWGLEVVGE